SSRARTSRHSWTSSTARTSATPRTTADTRGPARPARLPRAGRAEVVRPRSHHCAPPLEGDRYAGPRPRRAGMSAARDLGEGPLSRGSTVVYWFVVLEALLVVTTLPTIVAFLLLEQHASNIPLYALALVPVGPALSASVFAWRVFAREPDLTPLRHFWRGYRLNVMTALTVWIPALAALAVLGINLAYRDAAGLAGAFVVPSAVLAVVVALWLLVVTAVTAQFQFRWRDAARLSVYYLFARPLTTLGLVSFLVLCGGIVYVGSDWV